MKIGSISENKQIERRIAITPDIAKKYIALGFEIYISKNYGEHLGFSDDEYNTLGVKICDNENEATSNVDIIVQLGLPVNEKISLIKANQTLVGVLDPYNNKEKIDNLIKKKINIFFSQIFYFFFISIRIEYSNKRLVFF